MSASPTPGEPRFRVAVIGAGHWGPNLIRLFDAHPAAEVVAVAEPDSARRARVAARLPGARTTGDAHVALTAPDVDAVVVATPTSTHAALVRAALEHGKHVLVEKPLSDDAATAGELCALAEDSELVLMVGHVFLFNAAVRRAKRYIDDGELGRVQYISMTRTNLGPIRADVNAAWDLAAHDVSIADYWLAATPLAVSAVGGTWINPGIADAVWATLSYPGGVRVNLHASWLHPRKARDIAVVGERQMLTLDDLSLTEPIRLYDKGVSDEVSSARFADSFASFRASVREGDIVVPKVAMGEPLADEVDHFLDCVATGRRPVADGKTGLAVVRTLAAITRSMEAGGAEQPVHAATPVAQHG